MDPVIEVETWALTAKKRNRGLDVLIFLTSKAYRSVPHQSRILVDAASSCGAEVVATIMVETASPWSKK